MMPQQQPPAQPPIPDNIALAGMQVAHQNSGQLMSELMQMFAQADEVVKMKTPPPPIDPAIQKTFEAAMAEIKRKADESQARLNFDMKKAGAADQFAQVQEQNAMRMAEMESRMNMQLAAMQEESKGRLAMLQEQAKQETARLQQQVEIMKNDADNKQHQMTELMKNRDDNQTQIMLAQMKQALGEVIPQKAGVQDDGTLKEMQRLLGEIEKAKTGDALTATVEGLRQLMAGQQDHQQRTMLMAQQLLQPE